MNAVQATIGRDILPAPLSQRQKSLPQRQILLALSAFVAGFIIQLPEGQAHS
jgi:hypothetical protein